MVLRAITGYRQSMAAFLRESLQLSQEFLSEANFDGAFPHVFGVPSKESPEVHVRNECALLIRKAQLHMLAVLVANKNSNLHSMAVQMRVVLECAAQVVPLANVTAKGSESELNKFLNMREYETFDGIKRFSRDLTSREEITRIILDARRQVGNGRERVPKRVTPTDKVDALASGKSWYDHLSNAFCGSGVEQLSERSVDGGVMSINTDLDELTFATFLDYLADQVIVMLFGYGFLLIAVNGDRQPFESVQDLLNRKRSVSRNMKAAILRQF